MSSDDNLELATTANSFLLSSRKSKKTSTKIGSLRFLPSFQNVSSICCAFESTLNSLSIPAGFCNSGLTYDEITNHFPLEFNSKNIEDPLPGFMLRKK